MARRRKTRTHNLKGEAKPTDGSPKSFVVHTGTVGTSVKALSRDVRRVLEPNTATRLRERKSNKIKDFIAMSGPLHVTHLMVFNQSDANTNAAEDDKDDPTSNVNLRVTRLPRGPTLGFKVLRYALVRDILNATKRPRSPGKEFNTEPILILNNFSATNNTNDARQLTLMQTMFQNLFPPIKVHSMPLSNARRVVLLSYNPSTRTLDFRHYLITVRPVGVSRAVRKIIEGTSGRKRVREGSVYSAAASDVSSQSGIAGLRSKGLPDLSNAQDISDYILNHGDMGFLSSASEAESDASGDENGESTKQVELSSAYLGRANKKLGLASSSSKTENGGEKRAVKLTELGPRLELGLVKIEDGIGDGKGEVLFHEFIHKSAKEVAEINRRAKEKEKLAKERRAIQEANVKRKKEEKEKLKAERAAKKKAKIDAGEAQEGDDEEDEEEEESDNDEFEYEDMFAEEGEGKQNDEDEDGFGNDEDQELFDEDSEEDEHEDDDGEEDGDDSDLSPVAIDSSQSEDEAPSIPQRKKFKASARGGVRGGTQKAARGRGRKPGRR